MQTLTLTLPDDFHVHFRDGPMLAETVPATARAFGRAIAMPNLSPPVRTPQEALEYMDRLRKALPPDVEFEPLMSLYLTEATTSARIQEAQRLGILAAKLYPAGATTNSEAGVGDLEALYPVFEAMQAEGLLLLVHGEATDPEVDIFDREAFFIERHLRPIIAAFPELKIVLEHISTEEAVEFVNDGPPTLAATITPQHLLLNRNDMLAGGIRPHHYCLPVLKRRRHQEALRRAAISGSSKFFLGSDSAPHERQRKEASCGCAGVYSAPFALELYAEAFDQLDALDRLEAFAGHFGADFYGLARNKSKVTLVREPWTVPLKIDLPNGGQLVPLMAGHTLHWKLAAR